MRELAARLATAADAPAPQLRRMTTQELRDIGRTDRIMAEIPEMLYLDDRPNVLDAASTAKTLDVTPTSLDEVLSEMASEHARSML